MLKDDQRTIRILIRAHKRTLKLIEERGESKHRLEMLTELTHTLNENKVVYLGGGKYADARTEALIDG